MREFYFTRALFCVSSICWLATMVVFIGVFFLLFPSSSPAACLSPLPLWSTTHNSPGGVNPPADISVDSSNNVVVVGSESRPDIGQSRNWRIRKYDSDGTLLWSKDYNGPNSLDDYMGGLGIDGAGNVVVGGNENRHDIGQGHNWRLRKYDPNGSLLWSIDYDGPASNDLDGILDVAVDTDGNVIAVGREERTDVGQKMNFLVRKYDPDGVLLWSADYNSPENRDDLARGVTTDGDDNIIVVGQEDRAGLGQSRNWLIRKYSPNGTLLWSTSYNSPGNGIDIASRVATDVFGNIIVVGYEMRLDLGQGENWLVRKYDPDGGFLWSADYNSPANSTDVASSVAIDAGGNVIVAGYERRNDLGQEYNWLIRKYDPNGTLLWSFGYNGPDNFIDFGLGVVVDGNGYVIVAGDEFPPGPVPTIWRVHKYDRAYLQGTLTSIPSPAYVGQWPAIVLTVTNTGIVSVPISAPSLVVNSGTSFVTYLSGPIPSAPMTLAPGDSVAFTWTYSVAGAGKVILTGTVGVTGGSACDFAASAVLDTLLDVPPSPPINLTATVSGASIALGWVASTPGSAAIAGYNLYRGPVSGFNIISAAQFLTQVFGATTTVFIDTSVTIDVLYCYRIRAMDVDGLESGNSNESCATIPLPPVPYLGPIRVFPNPFNLVTAVRGTVKFEGLPVGTKVRIYTPRGLMVWEGEVLTANLVEWDGRSEGGKRVAPGTYMWVAAGDGMKERGTLIVQ